MFLLDDLLLAPVHGFVFVLRQIQEMAEKELNNESVLKQQLLQLQIEREQGRLSPDEFADQEAELFARLRAVKQRQMELREQLHSAGSSITIETRGLPEANRSGEGDAGRD